MKTVVAAVQMTSSSDKDSNLIRAEELITIAADRGARLVALPENFAFMGENAKAEAESLRGRTVERFKALAERKQIWLSLGGFQEAIPQSEKIYNTHVVINDRGEIAAYYRKIHLFHARLSTGEVYDEKTSVNAGREMAVVAMPPFCLGLSICFDLRFSQLYRGLRERGADILLIPAAFTKTTGMAHWEVLLRARAIETQSYVIAAAQKGRHSATRETHGQAMIVDPWGVILAECSENSPVAIAEIDLAYIQSLRENMPLINHNYS